MKLPSNVKIASNSKPTRLKKVDLSKLTIYLASFPHVNGYPANIECETYHNHVRWLKIFTEKYNCKLVLPKPMTKLNFNSVTNYASSTMTNIVNQLRMSDAVVAFGPWHYDFELILAIKELVPVIYIDLEEQEVEDIEDYIKALPLLPYFDAYVNLYFNSDIANVFADAIPDLPCFINLEKEYGKKTKEKR